MIIYPLSVPFDLLIVNVQNSLVREARHLDKSGSYYLGKVFNVLIQKLCDNRAL